LRTGTFGAASQGGADVFQGYQALPFAAALLSFGSFNNERRLFLMKYTKDDITHKLQEYPSLNRMKQQFEFELSLINEDQEHKSKLTDLLFPVVTELRRMDYYISLLDEEDSAVLTALFFEKLTYKATASKLHVDAKTIVNRRNHGLSELAAMYSRLPED
jgi:hypothetical protein